MSVRRGRQAQTAPARGSRYRGLNLIRRYRGRPGNEPAMLWRSGLGQVLPAVRRIRPAARRRFRSFTRPLQHRGTRPEAVIRLHPK